VRARFKSAPQVIEKEQLHTLIQVADRFSEDADFMLRIRFSGQADGCENPAASITDAVV
jgi:hypothetical protein